MADTFHTKAGNDYRDALTEWLQNTRLISEAVYRLYGDYQKDGRVVFSDPSWPKPKSQGEFPLSQFTIQPIPLGVRMCDLLKSSWSAQFVQLESLWEQYLQDVVLELRHKDVAIFEPFCEREYMASLVRDVLMGSIEDIEEIKNEAATRFATGITRLAWRDQWKQLKRLEVGLTDAAEKEPWFSQLDTYFEMRNCVIHRASRPSQLLHQKTSYYSSKNIQVIEIWPQHLDYYRKQFIACLAYVEERIKAKYTKQKQR
ncbi:MAG TPA: hypothetical protein DIT13_01255 [Verrucomicrobiales bacterium]|nr:hypothetical protein [Verrucomicrobiales bacterium]HRJ09823.1 hypothetical protein [Prosthecobacter sp.]HRK14724.1 hypothetical protein [Prosthecobacter sp.]